MTARTLMNPTPKYSPPKNYNVFQVSSIASFVAYNQGLWKKRDIDENDAVCSLRALASSLIDSADARQPKEGTFKDLPDYQCILRAALNYCDAAPPVVYGAKEVIFQPLLAWIFLYQQSKTMPQAGAQRQPLVPTR